MTAIGLTNINVRRILDYWFNDRNETKSYNTVRNM